MPFLIVNPAAQRGRVGRRWEQELRPALDAAGIKCTFALTRAPGHAIELAAEAAKKGHPVVCAVGGDGTSNEVFNGLLQARTGASFAAIPVGSGNDVPATFGIPEKDPAAAIACLRDGQDLIFDVGYAKEADRYFAGAASIGFDADVTDRASRQTMDRKSYILAVFQTLMTFRPYDLRIVVDGREMAREPRMLAAIGNGKRYGGGMHACPGAEVDDGRFAVTALRKMRRVRLLLVFPKVFDGRHVTHPQVDTFEGVIVEVSALDRPCRYQLDGDVMGTLPETFETRAKLLKVRVPNPYRSYTEQWHAKRRTWAGLREWIGYTAAGVMALRHATIRKQAGRWGYREPRSELIP
jgi:diacylglycerol kinase (ATP)